MAMLTQKNQLDLSLSPLSFFLDRSSEPTEAVPRPESSSCPPPPPPISDINMSKLRNTYSIFSQFVVPSRRRSDFESTVSICREIFGSDHVAQQKMFDQYFEPEDELARRITGNYKCT